MATLALEGSQGYAKATVARQFVGVYGDRVYGSRRSPACPGHVSVPNTGTKMRS
jgi:hypothetical protein